MDHYRTLGLSPTATKQQIKDAFRSCALKFHPDRHSQSSSGTRDAASLRFKQASEAYEVLIDDRKRADYDFIRRGQGAPFASSHNYNRGSGYGYGGQGSGGGGSGGYSYRAQPRREGRGGFEVEFAFQYVTSRRFLLNVALASALIGGTVVIEKCVEILWRANNSGKSFDETIQSVEKSRGHKENSR